MPRPTAVSAGLLLFRRTHGELEVFLVHPGGPFWKNRDTGAWSIPKGLINPGEEPLAEYKTTPGMFEVTPLKIGNTLLVGFSEEAYRQTLGDRAT